MDSNSFDVIILGTGLTESIIAASLSKAGFRLAHVDQNPFYGANEASLAVDEFIRSVKEHSDLAESSSSTPYLPPRHLKSYLSCTSPEVLNAARQYSLSLSPSIIPSVGPLISSLISSGVSRYGGYRLLERVGIYHSPGVVNPVPGSKEAVFKSKDISLVDKRRLMRFLAFAAGEFEGSKELVGKEELPIFDLLRKDFSLNDDIASAIAYSLAYCATSSDPALPALQRMRRFLRSNGRYGASSFLVGHYGGSGEIAQGFCRSAAVHGGVYILGRRITSIARRPVAGESSIESSCGYTLELEDFPDQLCCNIIISSTDYLTPELAQFAGCVEAPSSYTTTTLARGIAIVDEKIPFGFMPGTSNLAPESLILEEDNPSSRDNPDTFVLVFPPASVDGGSSSASVTALITGEGTMSAPKDKWIIYITMPVSSPIPESASAEALITPYLRSILCLASASDPPEPLLTAFYLEQIPDPPTPKSEVTSPTFLVTPSPAPLLPEAADSAAINAEAIFWKVIPLLQAARRRHRDAMADGGEVVEEREVESFWPLDQDTHQDTDEM